MKYPTAVDPFSEKTKLCVRIIWFRSCIQSVNHMSDTYLQWWLQVVDEEKSSAECLLRLRSLGIQPVLSIIPFSRSKGKASSRFTAIDCFLAKSQSSLAEAGATAASSLVVDMEVHTCARTASSSHMLSRMLSSGRLPGASLAIHFTGSSLVTLRFTRNWEGRDITERSRSDW